ncbi:hypothetical protein DNH61_22675 [Paenibacillus sambharensis]|uniref:SpoIIIAH-like family protein n=1 Tax=Paenibacillus sambharensis TaxID=1803190 RepID=A0A2W1LG54_9BACL|nr:SpoIIIAH-like family protein [Paenibacillus sambharensis]PZD93434.1 hypothetical protein DNH61_22675 [Paenibacillus sambharensis]
MNTKRQTVWLVSMLSLMVVLSAYYLFTEDLDSGSGSLTADTVQQTELQDGVEVSEGPAGADWLAESEAQNGKGTGALTDEEVLKGLETMGAETGGDEFEKYLYARNEEFQKEMDRLMGIVSDTKHDDTEATAALEELDKLEQMEEKLTSIEMELQNSFSKVAIAEENGTYKVLVESEQLERSEAADIINKVTDTMEVPASQVSVQYIP